MKILLYDQIEFLKEFLIYKNWISLLVNFGFEGHLYCLFVEQLGLPVLGIYLLLRKIVF